jgi:hypothetical protein
MVVLKFALVLILCSWSALGGRYHPDGRHRGSKTSTVVAEPDPRERTAEYWVEEARAAIRKRQARSGGRGRARNVIMFLGDGMSVPTLAAARALLGQHRQRPGEEAHLSFEQFPAVGLAKVLTIIIILLMITLDLKFSMPCINATKILF